MCFLASTSSPSWFGKWAAYSGYTAGANIGVEVPSTKAAPRPGPVDNSDLLPEGDNKLDTDDVPQMDAAATEGTDYVVLTQGAWRKLHGWYGGGPELPRPVILEGFITKKAIVAAHPYRLTVHHAGQQKVVLVPNQVSIRSCAVVHT